MGARAVGAPGSKHVSRGHCSGHLDSQRPCACWGRPERPRMSSAKTLPRVRQVGFARSRSSAYKTPRRARARPETVQGTSHLPARAGQGEKGRDEPGRAKMCQGRAQDSKERTARARNLKDGPRAGHVEPGWERRDQDSPRRSRTGPAWQDHKGGPAQAKDGLGQATGGGGTLSKEQSMPRQVRRGCSAHLPDGRTASGLRSRQREDRASWAPGNAGRAVARIWRLRRPRTT